MEYDFHIFSKYLAFQMKNLVFQSKYLVFRSKTFDFDQNTRYFESEFRNTRFFTPWIWMLGISSEIPNISNKVWTPGFLVDFMYVH